MLKNSTKMKVIFGSFVLCTTLLTGLFCHLNFAEPGIIRASSLDNQAVAKKRKELENNQGDYHNNHIVVHDITKKETEKLAKMTGADYRYSETGNFAVMYLDAGVSINDIYNCDEYEEYLERMEPDYYGHLCAEEETSDSFEITGNMDSFTYVSEMLNLGDTWTHTRGRGTKIAILDTGIDTENPYLNSKISSKSFNVSEGKTVSDFGLSVIEEDGELTHHGTEVASVIAADYDAELDTGGIAPDAELIIIKLRTDEFGRITSSDVDLGIAYAIECGADVINMSFAFPQEVGTRYTKLAADSNIICVASAGNDATCALMWPACDENVIGVGAAHAKEYVDYSAMTLTTTFLGVEPVEENEKYIRDETSNYGENIHVMAGNKMRVALDNSVITFKGTSCSAAMVTGAAALYLSLNKYTEVPDMLDVFCASSLDLGIPGTDWYYGNGLLDIHALVVEEKGTITYDCLSPELETEKHVFVRGHILQYAPEPERSYAVFDGWNYDINCMEEYDNLKNPLFDDLTVYAAWANEDDGVPFTYYVKDDGTAEITGYLGKRRYITIPDTIDEYTVTSIGERAFADNSRIRQVIFPDTLLTIEKYAFYRCNNLLSLNIPSSLKKIQDFAFSNCPRIHQVNFVGNGDLTSIGDYAFAECGSLYEMILPQNLAEVSGYAFLHDGNISRIEVDAGNEILTSDGEGLYAIKDGERKLIYFAGGIGGSYVVRPETDVIGEAAFAFSKLQHVILPAGLKEVEKCSFPYSNLYEIDIPDNVEIVNTLSFISCNNLREVTFGEQVDTIAEKAFSGCSSLERIVVEDELLTINSLAFSDCISLKAIDFLSGVAEIGYGAFYNCTEVEEVILPYTLESLGEFAFTGLHKLTTLVFEDHIALTYLQNWVFNDCPSLKHVTLPEGLEGIGNNCFMVTGLESVHIPSTVKEIGYGAFGVCQSLSNIEVAESNEFYYSVDNVLFERKVENEEETIILHTYPAALEGSYIIPETVQKIADRAFIGAVNLSDITFNNALEEIGNQAFVNCNSLHDIVLNNSLEVIGNSAFAECAILENVIFGEAVRDAGSGTFSGCYNLKTVLLNEGLTELKDSVFSETGLQNVAFPSTLQSIGSSCFGYCLDLQRIHITENIISIGSFAFNGDMNLQEISFAEGVKLSRFNYGAFACTGIESITIPASIQTMGQEVFSGCIYLKNVSFARGSKLKSLAAWTFSGADSLTSIVFEEDSELTHIQARALEYMDQLEEVDISSCLELNTIDNYAFNHCTSLNDLAIPENLTKIGRYAFYGCDRLTKIVLPETMDFVGRYAFAGISNIIIYFDSPILPEHLQEFWDYGIKGYYLGTGASFQSDDWEYTLLKDDTVVLLRYLGSEKNLVITQVDGHDVVAINEHVLNHDSQVETIDLPETLLSLGNYAFEDASSLKELKLPASLERIGAYAFNNSGIERVDFAEGSGLKSIDAYAFSNTKSLATIVLPSEVKRIEKFAFYESGVQEIVFEGGSLCEYIGRYAFSRTSLREISLPDSLDKVDYYAFEGCESLNTVHFGDGSVKLYGYAFYNSGLTEVEIPSELEYIGEFCFASCKQLTSFTVDQNNLFYSSNNDVLFDKAQKKLIQYPAARSGTYTIPDNTEVIGFGAFEGSAIENIVINDSGNLITLGYRAFYDCEYLTTVKIPATIRSLDFYCFAYCNRLQSIIIPEESVLNGIYEGAFYNCESLRSVYIPSEVQEIGEYAFYGCSALTTVNIQEGSSLKGIYSYAFEYSGIESFDSPENLIEIGDYAFAHSKLSFFRIGKNVEVFGEKILDNTNTLTRLAIANWKKSFYTVEELFTKGQIPVSLREISIEETDTIPPDALKDCSSVEYVEFDSDITSIGDYAFKNCTSLISITEISPFYIGKGAFSGCTSFVGEIDLSNVKAISQETFYRCESLVSIQNSGHIESYGCNCFAECRNLKNIDLAGAQFIYDGAFRSCGFEQIELSENLVFVGQSEGSANSRKGAFEGCLALKKVLVRDHSVGKGYNIDDRSFYGSGVKYAYFGTGLVKIGGAAFNSTPLKKIDLPETLKTIGRYAFDNTVFLRAIILPEGLETIEEGAFAGGRVYNNAAHVLIRKYIWVPESLQNLMSHSCEGANVFFEGSSLPANTSEDWHGDENNTAWFFSSEKGYELDDFIVVPRGNNIAIAAYLGNEEELYISQVGGKPVEEVMEGCFYEIPLVSCVFGDTLTQIGDWAFFSSGLQRIEVGDNLEVIGKRAFGGCSLYEFDPGSHLKMIGEEAFRDTNLKEFIFPDSLRSIGNGAFYSSDGLTDIRLNKGLEYIGDNAFESSGVINLTIPSSISYMGKETFKNCTRLRSVELNEGMRYISESAFKYCRSLEEIELPDSITNIGLDAFNGTGITFLVIPLSVNYMNPGFDNRRLTIAFYAEELPEGLEEGWDNNIKAYILGYRGDGYDEETGLLFRRYDEGIHIIGYSGTMAEVIIDQIEDETVVSVDEEAFTNNAVLEILHLGSGVKTIGDNAFSFCSQLRQVTISPESQLENIGDSAFFGCNKLVGFELPADLETIGRYAFSGVPFDKDELYITENIAYIGPFAFQGNRIKKIIFDNNSRLTKIEDYAFYGDIEELVLPDSIVTIGGSAFSSNKLTTVKLPQHLQSVGIKAFVDCPAAEHKDGLIYLDDVLIGYEDPGMTNCSIREGTRIMIDGIFNGVSSLTDVTIPESMQAIPFMAFTGTGMESLVIPASVSSIGSYALACMSHLEDLSIPRYGTNGFTFYREGLFGNGELNGWTMPGSLTTLRITGDSENVIIEDRVIYNFSLENLFIAGNPENVKVYSNSIKVIELNGTVENVDIQCPNLQECKLPETLKRITSLLVTWDEIVVPDTVEEIDELTCADERSLIKLILPENLKSLGIIHGNFTELTIPYNVSTITFGALQNCPKLQKLTLPVTAQIVGNKPGYLIEDYFQHIFGIPREWDASCFPESFRQCKVVEVNGEPEILPMATFKACKYIEELTLPNSIRKLETYSISECDNLKKLNFPANLEIIESEAIRSNAMRSITIPSNTRSLISDWIMWCDMVEELTLLCKDAEIGHIPLNNIRKLVLPFVGENATKAGKLTDMFDGELNNLESVTLLDSCRYMREDAFKGIEGITIYCYAEDAEYWPAGWNNGNLVYYLDKWNMIDFMVDGNLIASSGQMPGEPIRLPAKALTQKSDSRYYSYTFVGWDITGDGKADKLLTSNVRNYVLAEAVYDVTPIGDVARGRTEAREEDEGQVLVLEMGVDGTNVQKASAEVHGSDLSLASDAVRIETPIGSVRFDGNAVFNILSGIGDASADVGFTRVNASLISDSQTDDTVYDLSLSSDGYDVLFGYSEGISSGTAVVSLDCDMGQTKKPVVSYVADDGSTTELEAAYDETTGRAVFTTNHFSLYRIHPVEAQICTLIFDTDGGMEIEPYVRAVGRIISLPEAKKDGSCFSGWEDENGQIIPAGERYTMLRDTVLTAVWDKHEWTEPEYEWSEDFRTVTATCYCLKNEEHVSSETVETVYEVIQSPTETEMGRTTYLAVFENPQFEEQEKTVENIPKLGDLEVMVLPAYLTTIEEEAFAGSACEAVIISEGCEEIGTKAFAGCDNLQYIKIPVSVKEIAEDAFEDTPLVKIDR